MTLAGVKKQLSFKWEETDYKHEVRQSLLEIKGMLLDLRDGI